MRRLLNSFCIDFNVSIAIFKNPSRLSRDVQEQSIWSIRLTPNGDATPNLNKDAASSNNDEYNPTPNYLLPPPPRQHKKKVNNKSSELNVVIDRSFMCFLRPGKFNNQSFRRSQQPL